MEFSASQSYALQTTERVASVFSLVGTSFIAITFLSSKALRKPINRMFFYASLGNTLCNVATLISQDGIRAGQNSALCQFQGFLIQMFLPADALWNLSMAINVYLTLFKKYSPARLKALEWKYFLFNYGVTFIIALSYCFISTPIRGKIYGPAALWCWIPPSWDFMRLVFCYVPAWICILVAFVIYFLAGKEIFQKRKRLLSFSHGGAEVITENPFLSYKTTEVHITSELAQLPHLNSLKESLPLEQKANMVPNRGFQQYSITIERGPMSPHMEGPDTSSIYQRNTAALEANAAARSYTKCALLFFLSLLITWVPASINRVYSLRHPTILSFGFNYAASLVLPLMGFWNSVIYITTSWSTIKSLFPSSPSFISRRSNEARSTIHGLGLPGLPGRKSMTHARSGSGGARGMGMGRARTLSSGEISRDYRLEDGLGNGHGGSIGGLGMGMGHQKSRGSLSDSMKGLAG